VTHDGYKLYADASPTGDYRWVQLSFVVDDVVAAAQRWVDLYGVGPFYVLPASGPRPARYRGADTELDIRIAVTQAGPLQVELVEQRCDNPSVFRDVFARGQSGVHHVATMTDDFDAAVDHYARLGHVPVTELDTGMGRVAYVDTFDAVGVMTEIVERSVGFTRSLAGTAKVCALWDGTDPVRQL
jgi:hypothetical protein